MRWLSLEESFQRFSFEMCESAKAELTKLRRDENLIAKFSEMENYEF